MYTQCQCDEKELCLCVCGFLIHKYNEELIIEKYMFTYLTQQNTLRH